MNRIRMVVFFKQRAADEMRSSDWSSDLCASDLTTGESPGAVFPSAARALYSTFIGNPIKRLSDGMTRMSFVSSGESCDIFQARLNTSAAWRSEERRVGQECVSTCRPRWSPYPSKTPPHLHPPPPPPPPPHPPPTPPPPPHHPPPP